MRIFSRILLPLVSVLIVTSLFLFSCNKRLPPIKNISANLSRPFSTTAKINYMTSEFTADIVSKGSGAYSITIAQPVALKGVCFDISGDTINITYQGFKLDLGTSNLPVTPMAKAIAAVVLDASSPISIKISPTSEGIKLSGNSKIGKYAIIVSSDLKSIKSIEIPEIQLSAKFSDFKFT